MCACSTVNSRNRSVNVFCVTLCHDHIVYTVIVTFRNVRDLQQVYLVLIVRACSHHPCHRLWILCIRVLFHFSSFCGGTRHRRSDKLRTGTRLSVRNACSTEIFSGFLLSRSLRSALLEENTQRKRKTGCAPLCSFFPQVALELKTAN